MGVMTIYYVVMMVLKILICRPISMFWDKDVQGQCFNQRILILTDNVISVVSDVMILLLPCPMTKSLNMKLKAKIKVAVVFGVGGLACVFSLARLVFIIKEAQSEDQTYAFVQINLLG
jgi:nitrate reductase gamma subunit